MRKQEGKEQTNVGWKKKRKIYFWPMNASLSIQSPILAHTQQQQQHRSQVQLNSRKMGFDLICCHLKFICCRNNTMLWRLLALHAFRCFEKRCFSQGIHHPSVHEPRWQSLGTTNKQVRKSLSLFIHTNFSDQSQLAAERINSNLYIIMLKMLSDLPHSHLCI